MIRQVHMGPIRWRQRIRSSFSSSKSVLQLFEDRNLFYQTNAEKQLNDPKFLENNRKKAAYCGYDPTAPSLHIGNLISILMLTRLNKMGMRPIFLVGGATGLIGDPSGKNKQRELLNESVVKENIQSVSTEIFQIHQKIKRRLIENASKYDCSFEEVQNLQTFQCQVVNNFDFYQNMNFIEFLRGVGKNFRMSPLLARQMVAKRLQSQQGISFAQFSYSLMQGYDFSQLYQREQCVMQIGGSDQWGNILNGTELIRRKFNHEAYGITMPLLLTKSGSKFGKSDGNALFLNPEFTPTKEIYQYFYNTADEDLEKYLRIFTFLSLERITDILQQHSQNREKRIGQAVLADEVTDILGGYLNVQKQLFSLSSEALKSKSLNFLEHIFSTSSDGSVLKWNQAELGSFKQWADLFVKSGLCKTKKECRRQIEAGGLYVNNRKIEKTEPAFIENFGEQLKKQILFDRFLILRQGKKKFQLIDLNEI